MKTLIMTFIATSIFSSAVLANPISATSNNPAFQATAVTTSSPTFFTVAAAECVYKNYNWSCVTATTLAPITSSTLAAIILLKEEIQQVEGDAYNFMAGEPMTLALEELVNKVRSEHEELKDRTDKEIAVLLINVLEIQ